MIEIVFFVLALTATLLAVWGVVHYMGMTYEGYPKNPLRWAQEDRRRDKIARRLHISRLEHELGYRPCSADNCLDPKCIVAGTRNGGHPIWDDPSLPAPPPMDLTALTKQAYDKEVRNAMYPLYKYGRTSGGGPR
jgi:hypothetical protein